MSRCAVLPVLAACLALSACVPWTTRPLNDKAGDDQSRPFNAQRYVDSIWNSKVLPAVHAATLDASQLHAAAAQGPRCFLVRGTGKVLKVDTTSREGLLLIDFPPYDGRPDAAIEIGPVIGGTVLRDALPFIQFSNFVNQLQFAQVGNALNDRVLAGLPPMPKPGSTVTFNGAGSWVDGTLQIVPVTLEKS
jgi:predicted lipoprotein